MENLETLLDRWRSAAIIDLSTAERIRNFEAQREPKRSWAVIVAVVFGCVMVGAGILLFIAAHWDDLSPAQRFALVVGQVALFHVLGAIFAKRSQYLSMALHFIGSAALGAGIFLAGQIFNLEEHWPGGILLWAVGVAIAWWLLRDWAQGLLLSILAPFWLFAEWMVRVGEIYGRGYHIAVAFVLMLAIVYLGAVRVSEQDALRRSLMWVGGIAFFPLVFALSFTSWDNANPQAWSWKQRYDLPAGLLIAGWIFALATPLLLGYLMRRERTLWHLGAAAWVLGLAGLSSLRDPEKNILVYLWCLVGSVAMIWWGVDDRRKERINLGMAAFAITLICFYFSNVLDKFGRSTALIAMGLIFLVGGYYMERLRRRLVAQVKEATV